MPSPGMNLLRSDRGSIWELTPLDALYTLLTLDPCTVKTDRQAWTSASAKVTRSCEPGNCAGSLTGITETTRRTAMSDATAASRLSGSVLTATA
jgi:hypothetical protein